MSQVIEASVTQQTLAFTSKEQSFDITPETSNFSINVEEHSITLAHNDNKNINVSAYISASDYTDEDAILAINNDSDHATSASHDFGTF